MLTIDLFEILSNCEQRFSDYINEADDQSIKGRPKWLLFVWLGLPLIDHYLFSLLFVANQSSIEKEKKKKVVLFGIYNNPIQDNSFNVFFDFHLKSCTTSIFQSRWLKLTNDFKIFLKSKFTWILRIFFFSRALGPARMYDAKVGWALIKARTRILGHAKNSGWQMISALTF